jgi:hypothetical protein
MSEPAAQPAAPGASASAGDIRTVDLPCTACGARDDEWLFTGREHEYDNTTDRPFDVVRCRRCGLVRLNPRPDVSELGRIYPPNYYAYDLAT